MPRKVKFPGEMLPFVAPPSKPKSERSELPIVPELMMSFSRWKSLRDCSRRFYLQTSGAWGGWDKGSSLPPTFRQAYYLSQLQGIHAWVGNIVHEFLAKLLFSRIDEHLGERTGLRPVPTTLLIREAHHLFEQGWEESKQLSVSDFLKLPKPKDVTFFVEHASGYIHKGNDAQHRRQFQSLLERCLSNVDRVLPALLAGSEPEHWKVIEGKYLDRGRIITYPEDLRSQEEIRRDRTPPYTPLSVGGLEFKYFNIPDFVLHYPETNIVRIIDFKSGKERIENRDQVLIYGALHNRRNPQLYGWENMVMTLFYLESGKISNFQFVGEEEMKRYFSRAEKQCSELLERLTPVRNVERELLRQLVPAERAFADDGRLLESRFPAGERVALPVNFGPTAAKGKHVYRCYNCPFRLPLHGISGSEVILCNEGAKAVALQRFNRKQLDELMLVGA